MKKHLLITFLGLLFMAGTSSAQITSPQIKAGFGIDADLRANFFNGFIQAGNDDWFRNLAGPGMGVIDTVGAAFINSRYISNPSSRSWPFFKGMAYPQFSIVNNKMLIDAIFIRDHHGDDSTVFASGSNKNGMNPNSWSTPVSQGIPDKNDILDMYMHVRREGPNTTDSLWFFGGLSLDNTTGNRYFDFEMYQTDIVYNRPTLSFVGYGPDAGHTAWQFDAAGNVTKTGDIIFTAEYGSSSLSFIEARIWVHQSSLSITPAGFTWGGAFDGGSPSAVFGYASITPKTAGNFYYGLQCGNNTWAGPFQVVLQNNTVSPSYTARQFMEFSVNLSKLGLDPLVTVNDACALPFRRILVKSRASTSFTAELKDFVGPFSFFRAPAAAAVTNFPVMCPNNISNIWVTNPVSTSIYTWRTTNGNIVGDTVGPSITVDQPGTYIVMQELMDSCKSIYASDTIEIGLNNDCTVLGNKAYQFRASQDQKIVWLNWKIDHIQPGYKFEIERSFNGITFYPLSTVIPEKAGSFTKTDDLSQVTASTVYYRLKVVLGENRFSYSQVEQVNLISANISMVRVLPNPASDYLLLQTDLKESFVSEIAVYDIKGLLRYKSVFSGKKGFNQWQIHEIKKWNPGIYYLQITLPNEVIRRQILITR